MNHKDLIPKLEGVGYKRVTIKSRDIRTETKPAKKAAKGEKSSKPVVETRPAIDIFLQPGGLIEDEVGNWPALRILGESGATYDEAQIVPDGSLRIRDVRLPETKATK